MTIQYNMITTSLATMMISSTPDPPPVKAKKAPSAAATAAAYNFNSKESQDEIWERNNLINFIANKIGCEGRIKAAPTRLSLTIFGGHLSITDFRNYCNTTKMMNINFPPMMTLTQQIEEVNASDMNNEFKYIPVDTDRINKYKEKITLKRSKPINAHENTLDHAMNLKFGEAHEGPLRPSAMH